jgi:hypothetical protein
VHHAAGEAEPMRHLSTKLLLSRAMTCSAMTRGLSSSAVWDYESPGFQKLLSCARGGRRARAVARSRGASMHNCGFMIDHAFMRTALLVRGGGNETFEKKSNEIINSNQWGGARTGG